MPPASNPEPGATREAAASGSATVAAATPGMAGAEAAPGPASGGVPRRERDRPRRGQSEVVTGSGSAAGSGSENETASGTARKRKQGKAALDLEDDPALQRLQDERQKAVVLEFLRDSARRSPGERWLFLARHFDDLGQPESARELLKKLMRADPVDEPLKWQGQLLLAKVLQGQKLFAEAKRELDRLLSWPISREIEVEARLAKARLLSRDLTHYVDLLAAYRRYHKYFPDANEEEELRYLSGFEKGYNLEIAMDALVEWEAIAKFREPEAAAEAKLQLALIDGYDLDRAPRALETLATMGPPWRGESGIRALLVRGALLHLHLQPPGDPKVAHACYREFVERVPDLRGWRIGNLLLGGLLRDRLGEPREAVEVFATLTRVPAHLATETTLSVLKERERADDDREWAILGHKLAGHCAEFQLHDLDRALAEYRQGLELVKAAVASGTKDDGSVFWFETAVERCQPQTLPPQVAFDQATERYRARDHEVAVRMYDAFVASHSDSPLRREAMFRAAVITDDDLHRYDEALERYRAYMIEARPRKSPWQLDAIYDWGRADEVRYRIGNLQARHRAEFVKALETFSGLSSTYPDSFWAKQATIDSIEIYRKKLDDENQGRLLMRRFIDTWPADKKAQDYRKYLVKQHLQAGELGAALPLLQDLIDHGEPIAKETMEYRQQLRDLGFWRQRNRLRAMLDHAGAKDRVTVFTALIDVMALATSTAPLEELGKEIGEHEDLAQEERWALTYRLGTRLYSLDPARAKTTFVTLAANSSGSTRLKCLLTLGNLAYRIERSQGGAIEAYEAAMAMVPPEHAPALERLLETPLYRLGRLYALRGEGVKAITTLNRFLQRFPRSRHTARAYLARAQIELALNRPDLADRSLRRARFLDPSLIEKTRELETRIEAAPSADEWLASRLAPHQRRVRLAHRDFVASLTAAMTATGTPRILVPPVMARRVTQPAPIPGIDDLGPGGIGEYASSTAGTVIAGPGGRGGRGAGTGSGPPGDEGTGVASGSRVPARRSTTADVPIDQLDLDNLPATDLYQRYQAEAVKAKPVVKSLAALLVAILRRPFADERELWPKACRHLISWRLFRKPDEGAFVGEAKELLERHNFGAHCTELLYRYAQALDRGLGQFETANKAYFEYLSFFPDGPHAAKVRCRIPEVYEKLEDYKNADRFYRKVIEDRKLPADLRVTATVNLGRMLAKNDGEKGKAEIQRLLEAALALDTDRKPELYLRLERLTSKADYIELALEAEGKEEHRLTALKRLVKKLEEKEHEKALALIEKYREVFTDPEAVVWIDKKLTDLGKRHQISKMEEQIELFPEEPQTPQRIFQLAQLVEGLENTRYRSQDLFYEITLVYPQSQFFRESKIRAENTKTIRAIAEITAALKKGVKDKDGDLLLLERARLYSTRLQDSSKAQEDYEALLTLFPASPRRWEALRGLADALLKADRNAERALKLYEDALLVCNDPAERRELVLRIEALTGFRDQLLRPSSPLHAQQAALDRVLSVWRVADDPERALALIRQARGVQEHKPIAARLWYLEGRILEARKQFPAAIVAYRKVVDSLHNPGARRDLALYRIYRLHLAAGDRKSAEQTAIALITRYPRSLLARSAWYRLAKWREERGELAGAYHALERLLAFRTLRPPIRAALIERQRDLGARMNLADLDRLRKQSRGQDYFRYLAGRLLEHDQSDPKRAMGEYQAYLATMPGPGKARELLLKLANMAEKSGDFAAAAGYLDQIISSRPPCAENLDLVTRIGALLEERVNNPELTTLFYEHIAETHRRVPAVRNFARGKIVRVAEKASEKPAKVVKRGKRRVYSDADKEVLTEIDEIVAKFVDDQQDYVAAERELVELWEANPDSQAIIDVMKELVALNEEYLLDPGKAAEFYQRYIDERPGDPEIEDLVLKMYDLYAVKMQDGQKALRVLEDFSRRFPTSPKLLEIELKLGRANEELVRNYEEARRVYQRIIDTRRNEPVIHETYFRMGHLLRAGFADYQGAIAIWEQLIRDFYQNEFADDAQYEIGLTYEAYLRDFTKARDAYNEIKLKFPNSPLQNKAHEALLRVGG